MGQPKNKITDHVNLMVFKDNYAARTFKLPLRWLSRLGILVGLLIVITVGSLLLVAKYSIALRQASPERVQELEMELSDLKASGAKVALSEPKPLPSLDLLTSSAPTATPVATPVVVATSVAEPPIPASAMTPALAPVALAKGYLFSALPLHTENLSEKGNIPIGMHGPKVVWQGKTLNVSFNIQYHAEDKGNQQGRIVVLARGPEVMMAYPEGVLNRSGQTELIAAKRGEYFSVSRFREVRAKFGPMKSQDSIKEVEVILLNEEGQIMIYQNLIPQTPPAPRVRQEVSAPSESSPAPEAPSVSAPSPKAGEP